MTVYLSVTCIHYIGCPNATYEVENMCFSEPANGTCPGGTNFTLCSCDDGFIKNGTTCEGLLNMLSFVRAE